MLVCPAFASTYGSLQVKYAFPNREHRYDAVLALFGHKDAQDVLFHVIEFVGTAVVHYLAAMEPQVDIVPGFLLLALLMDAHPARIHTASVNGCQPRCPYLG